MIGANTVFTGPFGRRKGIIIFLYYLSLASYYKGYIIYIIEYLNSIIIAKQY